MVMLGLCAVTFVVSLLWRGAETGIGERFVRGH
jgi:hypothetical protein